MPIRPCTCPTSARRSERFNWSRRSPVARARRQGRPRAGADVQSRTIRRFRRRCGTILARLLAGIADREAHQYPPLAAMVRMVVRGSIEGETRKTVCARTRGTIQARHCNAGRRDGEYSCARSGGPGCDCARIGTTSCRVRMASLCGKNSRVPEIGGKRRFQWTADVDPLDML